MEKDTMYQGKAVNVLRDAQAGDPGFDESKNQVVIQYADKNEDGAEMVVEKNELS